MTNDEKIILAVELGYTCNVNGSIYNPDGYQVRLYPGSDGWAFYVPNKYRDPGRVGRRSTVIIRVHRFIAYFKFGKTMFEPGMLVRHDNDNPFDNAWSNILIGTVSDNNKDAFRNGSRSNKGHKHSQFKMTPDKVKLVMELKSKNYHPRTIAKSLGVSKNTIYRVLRNEGGIYY